MFADGTLRVWRAYDIGQGKSIVLDNVTGQCYFILKKAIIYRHFYRKNSNKHSGCIYKKDWQGVIRNMALIRDRTCSFSFWRIQEKNYL